MGIRNAQSVIEDIPLQEDEVQPSSEKVPNLTSRSRPFQERIEHHDERGADGCDEDDEEGREAEQPAVLASRDRAVSGAVFIALIVNPSGSARHRR